MMEADVARYPLQQPGQLVIGASFDGGFDEAPLVIVLEVGILELMLNIEQPNAHHSGQPKDRGLDEKQAFPTDP